MKQVHPVMASVLLAIFSGRGEKLPGTEQYKEFPIALPGVILKVYKDSDPETGAISIKSNRPEVSSAADLIALEAVEEHARWLANGRLDQALAKKARTMNSQQTLSVAVRVKNHGVARLDKTKHSQEQLIVNAREILNAGPIVEPQAVIARYGLSAVATNGNDIVIVNADRARLNQLKSDNDVSAVWENNEELNLTATLPELPPSAYNPGSIPSGAGSGVKSATFEIGLTSTFLSCIGVSPTYDSFSGGSDADKLHTQATFRLLAIAAPSATLYHRKSTTYNGSGDASFITNNAIQTLSLSKTRGGQNPHKADYPEFLTMDAMAYTYPYPLFASPSGNDGYSYVANWQNYNGINVGNVRHTNGTTFEMAECSQTKNPPPIYGNCISGSDSTCAGDREMPQVVAPGIPATGTTFSTTCLEGGSSIGCGTSLSAPNVNGIAADIIAADSRMVSWPEKVRAVLVLTAENVEDAHWVVGTDERDGAGTVSGYEAVAFAQNHTSVTPGGSAAQKGMTASSWYASDFSSNKRFYYQVPNPKPSGKHLRVVLTWDSNPIVDSLKNKLSDLDLTIERNGGTTSSAARDANFEVVDISSSQHTAGSTYYIDIVPVTNRIPSVGPSYFYYALAWSWVKD